MLLGPPYTHTLTPLPFNPPNNPGGGPPPRPGPGPSAAHRAHGAVQRRLLQLRVRVKTEGRRHCIDGRSGRPPPPGRRPRPHSLLIPPSFHPLTHSPNPATAPSSTTSPLTSPAARRSPWWGRAAAGRARSSASSTASMTCRRMCVCMCAWYSVGLSVASVPPAPPCALNAQQQPHTTHTGRGRAGERAGH